MGTTPPHCRSTAQPTACYQDAAQTNRATSGKYLNQHPPTDGHNAETLPAILTPQHQPSSHETARNDRSAPNLHLQPDSSTPKTQPHSDTSTYSQADRDVNQPNIEPAASPQVPHQVHSPNQEAPKSHPQPDRSTPKLHLRTDPTPNPQTTHSPNRPNINPAAKPQVPHQAAPKSHPQYDRSTPKPHLRSGPAPNPQTAYTSNRPKTKPAANPQVPHQNLSPNQAAPKSHPHYDRSIPKPHLRSVPAPEQQADQAFTEPAAKPQTTPPAYNINLAAPNSHIHSDNSTPNPHLKSDPAPRAEQSYNRLNSEASPNLQPHRTSPARIQQPPKAEPSVATTTTDAEIS